MSRLLFYNSVTTDFNKDDSGEKKLLQLAFLLYDDTGHLIQSGNYNVKPCNFTIPDEASKLYGITLAKAAVNGTDINNVIVEFLCQLIRADYIICHNYEFHHQVISTEAARAGLSHQFNTLLETRQAICTKKTTANLVKIPGPYGSHAWPKLSELYHYLFKSPFKAPQLPTNKVKACAKCFFELRQAHHYSLAEDLIKVAC